MRQARTTAMAMATAPGRGRRPTSRGPVRWPAWVLSGLLMLLTAAWPAPALADTDDAAPAPPVVPGVPEQVAAWFRDGALAAASAATTDLGQERDSLRLGLVRPVHTWSAAFLGGGNPEPATVAVDRWAAPLLTDGGARAVVLAQLDGGQAGLEEVLTDADLAGALADLPADVPFVHDDPLDGWFSVAEGEVRPLDEAAREVLAGPAPVDVYQPFVVARYAGADGAEPGQAAPAAEPERSWSPVVVVGVVLLVLLVWAGLIVWLRRPAGGDGPARGTPRRREAADRSARDRPRRREAADRSARDTPSRPHDDVPARGAPRRDGRRGPAGAASPRQPRERG
ncbi:hypothetical protein MF406_15565 [Georgenia sp. TF02-10]|uniref:hypothetical protein n=1 Tax=Georgenia sp. TF02-10 TaxID=2917725 RepID=UPI001FA730F8|nr:hypothetical protein [Georgenia sp. TF02-10]UNX54320.1 hypothetical protein MF406_15565 [Georgenia sp. TF02-10]